MSYKSVLTLQQLRWSVAQFFEQRWWKNYLSSRPAETYLAWKSAYWEGFLKKTGIKVEQQAEVLDAGTGPAGIQMILSEQHVTAIDPLMDQYQKLSHFNPSDYPWTHFKKGSLEELEACAVYDHVFCLNVINHVVDIESALSRLCDGLKTGGNIVLSIDCHNHHWAQAILRRIPLDILHPHQLRLDEYEMMLKTRGIEINHRQRLRSGGLFDYWVISGVKA